MDEKCQECVRLSLTIRCLNKEIEELRQRVVELEKEVNHIDPVIHGYFGV